MKIKTIGLTLLSAETTGWLAPVASTLARRHDAHLIGVHAAEPIVPYTTVTAFDPIVAPAYLDWQDDQARDIRKLFEDATSREGVKAEFRGQDTGAIGAEAYLVDALRACDLVISPRVDKSAWSPVAARLQEQVIRHSGRPVLVLPKGSGFNAPVSRLMMGISNTREANRAAHDALALASSGAVIDLVSVLPQSTSEPLGFDFRQDLAMALDRLGYKVNLVDRSGEAADAGEVLLRASAELGAELVVTGAFGHSRTYDFVIGAVTGHLLSVAEVPVLYSK